MQTQYTAETLQEAIKALEIRQAEEEKHLRAQFINVYENLKPINILKNMVKDIATNDSLKYDVTNAVTSLMSGFISKKIIIGRSKNPFLKLLGLGIQFGMTTLVSSKYNFIKDYIANFVNLIQERRDEKDSLQG